MLEKNKIVEYINKVQEDSSYEEELFMLLNENWEGNLRTIEETLDAINALAEKLSKNQKSSKLLLIKLRYKMVIGEYKKVIEDAVTLYKKYNNEEGRPIIPQLCDLLLVSYMKVGKLDAAIYYGLEGINIAEEQGNHTMTIKLLISTMQLYLTIMDFEKVQELSVHLNTIDYFFTDENSLLLETALFELNLRQELMEETIEHAQKAYELAKGLDNKRILAKILYLRGELNMLRELHVQAEKDFDEALHLAQSLNEKELYINALLARTFYFMHTGKNDLAKGEAEEILKLAEEIDAPLVLEKIYRVLGEIYAADKNWELAYSYSKQSGELQKKCFSYKASLWLGKLDHKHMSKKMVTYKLLYQQMRVISKIGQSFTMNVRLEKLQGAIFEQVSKVLQLDILAIGFYNGELEKYQVYNYRGEALQEKSNILRHTNYLANYAIENHMDIFVNNGNFEAYDIHAIEDEVHFKIQSVIFTPLTIEDRMIGVIGIGNYRNNAYTPNDLNTLKIIASYLAIALENANLFDEIEFMAKHDSLTGLLSRGEVIQRGQLLFKENQKANLSMAVVMLDVDFFKLVNDKYGHQIGDIVLYELGKIIQYSLRKDDFAGRYGGEEFLVVLNNLSEEEALLLAKQIRIMFEKKEFGWKKDKEIRATISGGIYVTHSFTLNFEEAIRFADLALYRAKMLGRNCIVNYNASTKRKLDE